jgi:hypothetical protein
MLLFGDAAICDEDRLMHQRVRCPECHHWTDALLVWAAGDCCPRCNAPVNLGEPTLPGEREATAGEPGRRTGWASNDRPWRTPGRIRPGALGERRF